MSSRQVAFLALQQIHYRGAFADIVLDQLLRQEKDLKGADRALATELVYGCVRQRRSLDFLIDQFAKKPADQQPPKLRLILHLGFYQLHYLSHIPAAAAVHSTVELAKENGLGGLKGLVNGILRQYLRSQESQTPLPYPADSVQNLALRYSYPDWIVANWIEQFGAEEAEKLCQWMNQSPNLDLRVNPLNSSLEEVKNALQEKRLETSLIPHLPQGLRVTHRKGETAPETTLTSKIAAWPGFETGWWTIQDSSAQLVSYLVEPQPGETIIDACAAPGGKTTHLAELMENRGKIWACDKTPSRLKKVRENAQRLGIDIIETVAGDSRSLTQFKGKGDRLLLDAPCSGLGTLHRHADARWRQTPESVQELSQLQRELLDQAITWLKPQGILVYATCTLHPAENEQQIESFLARHPDWQILPPAAESPLAAFATSSGWMKVLPHHHHMDGFFMVRLQRKNL